jgi:hypothetical protein
MLTPPTEAQRSPLASSACSHPAGLPSGYSFRSWRTSAMSRPCALRSVWRSGQKNLATPHDARRAASRPHSGDLGQVYDPGVWLGGLPPGRATLRVPPAPPSSAAQRCIQPKRGRPSINSPAVALCWAWRPVTIQPSSRPSADWHRRDVFFFREYFAVLRQVLTEEFPRIHSGYSVCSAAWIWFPSRSADCRFWVPGSSRQALGWIAAEADGCRPLERQADLAAPSHLLSRSTSI